MRSMMTLLGASTRRILHIAARGALLAGVLDHLVGLDLAIGERARVVMGKGFLLTGKKKI